MIPINKLRLVPDDSLRALNCAIIDELRHRQALSVRNFRVGQKASFFSPKKGRTVVLAVTQINRTTVSGTELDVNGNRTFQTWRVAPSLLSLV